MKETSRRKATPGREVETSTFLGVQGRRLFEWRFFRDFFFFLEMTKKKGSGAVAIVEILGSGEEGSSPIDGKKADL